MTYPGGLPYEECKRAQRQGGERAEGPLTPGFAMPPFHPACPPKPRRQGPRHRATARHSARPRRYVRVDGAAVSGLLTVFCVATLLVTITLASVRG